MLLQCLLKNGLKIRMLLVLSQNQGDMAEHLPTKILPSNLLHGYLQNLSYILLKIINGLNLMKTVVYHYNGM